MGTRVLLLVLLGACWSSSPPAEQPRMVGVDCDDIALQGTPRGPGYDAFVEGRWSDVITEIGEPTGSDVGVMRAYFRVSWAHSKLGDARASMRALARALDLAEHPVYRESRRRAELQHEVLSCLIGLFATEPTITPDEIREYMISNAGLEYARAALQRLAEVYVISGRTLAADRALALVPPRPPRTRRR